MTDEWDEALIEADDNGGEDAESDQPEPLYSSVEEWVIGWFAPIIRRKLTGDHCWCPQWWQHPEVISRLDALWRSWEGLRLDATTGMSVWWRDHFGPHWAELVDRDRSPMSQCHPKDGHVGEYPELPVERAPAGTWGTAPES
ncbi:DUF4913 domain-containing protein [Saccharopolyspora griseoalba]|uniref:DUF4913 domain-containing protein n=1 Tax=Saccharopolyspora griseoalba TaxID=1431848 RepID=A0ABW2LUI6_9PSEU